MSNLRKGKYKIPRDTNITADCLDFLNSCLQFDASKRKTYDELLAHPFLNVNNSLQYNRRKLRTKLNPD